MLNVNDILETINMIQNENLDIRTVTMGISLLDCIDSDIDKACDKVYDKITRYAYNLIPVCDEIQKKYGIPIVNRRISVTPIAMLASACQTSNIVKFAHTLDKAAKTVGVKEVLVPARNKRNVAELDEEIISGLKITYVEEMNEVIKHALKK